MTPAWPGKLGWVLLEVQVGLAVFGLVISGAVWTSAEWTRAVDRIHRTEVEVRTADRLMTAVSLWPREDLDRHIGVTRQGHRRLWIERPNPTLYHVQILDDATGGALLETWLFREDPWAR